LDHRPERCPIHRTYGDISISGAAIDADIHCALVTKIDDRLRLFITEVYGLAPGRDAGGTPREERDLVSKPEVVPLDERAPESCLHCDINDLLQEHVEGQEKVDLVALAANMAESLVDLILLAPED